MRAQSRVGLSQALWGLWIRATVRASDSTDAVVLSAIERVNWLRRPGYSN